MAELRALIFDLDGTLAETEELHRLAFNRAFAEAGLETSWDVARYRELLAVTGGKRRIIRHFEDTGVPVDDALVTQLHLGKNSIYAEAVAAGVDLRPGIAELVEEAKAEGLALAIATTTSRNNLEAFLAAVSLPAFDVTIAGEDVAALKPDPEAYTRVLARLGISADAALAFEDSTNGLRAARAAGLRTIVTPGTYTVGQDFAGATLVLRDLGSFDLSRWR